jgi:hypothetical protein
MTEKILSGKSEPAPSRTGIDRDDRTLPFYWSELEELLGYYPGYDTAHLRRNFLAYVEAKYFGDTAMRAGGEPAMGTASIEIEVKPGRYAVPPSLAEHARAAVQLFTDLGRLKFIGGAYENNTTVRIIDFSDSGKITCQEASYFDQLATNLTMDWASTKLPGMTIRSDVERPQHGRLKPLGESLLANTLGVAAIIFDRNFDALLRVRSAKLASINDSRLHCSASGVFESQRPLTGRHDASFFAEGMRYEIERETGLRESDYALFPVAFARELPRGGKPQLFYVAVSDLSLPQIAARSRHAAEAGEFLTGEAATLDASPNHFTYEGWAALHFAQLFVAANRKALTQRIADMAARR